MVLRKHYFPLIIITLLSPALRAMQQECTSEDAIARKISPEQLLALQALSDLDSQDLSEVLKIVQEKPANLPPLHKAVKLRNRCHVEELLEHECVNQKTVFSQRTPLHFAALEGAHELAELLIAKKADITLQDREGRTPLHLAALEGHEMTVAALLRSGACRNIFDKKGKKPYDLAREKNHTKTAQLLSSTYANQDTIYHAEALLLKKLIQLSAVQSIRKFLLDGLDIEDFTTVIEEAQKLALLFNNDFWFLLLTETLSDIYRENECTKIWVASQLCKECYGWLEHLIDSLPVTERKRELNKCIYDTTPLLAAVSNNAEKIISLLCERGADLNVSNSKGVTPLMRAAAVSSRALTEKLVRLGSPLAACDSRNFTALHYAIDEDNESAALFLISLLKESPHKSLLQLREKKEGRSPLLLAIVRGNPKVVAALLEAGVEPLDRDNNNWTSLKLAIKNCGPEGMNNVKLRSLCNHATSVDSCDECSIDDVGRSIKKIRAEIIKRAFKIIEILCSDSRFKMSEEEIQFCRDYVKMCSLSREDLQEYLRENARLENLLVL